MKSKSAETSPFESVDNDALLGKKKPALVRMMMWFGGLSDNGQLLVLLTIFLPITLALVYCYARHAAH
ncbi:MAG: hypothetical protein PHG25_02680 [Candidatus Pacebacteria bacterium]|nr:hypothetical protein [Candidatus Paceibacterota bacterium]